MKVTRLPHDGRMIFGGKGVLFPFRLESDDAVESQLQVTVEQAPASVDKSYQAVVNIPEADKCQDKK